MKSLSPQFIETLIVKQALKRLTLTQLAHITGVNRGVLGRIINNQVEAVQERTFDKLNNWLLSEKIKENTHE